MDPHTNLLRAASELAQNHHRQYDSSHDYFHVRRVTNLALAIASLSISSAAGEGPDLLVVTLAALFHDLLDAKYLPADAKQTTAQSHLAPFWGSVESSVTEEQKRLVERITENVSYTKEVARGKEGETDWHRTCVELHCVQDADKLDAIGAIGILRCSAFSGAKSIPLVAPPSTTPGPPGKSSAIDHFHEKLFNLEGMMRTVPGREMARSRTLMMRAFVEQTESEFRDASGLF